MNVFIWVTTRLLSQPTDKVFNANIATSAYADEEAEISMNEEML